MKNNEENHRDLCNTIKYTNKHKIKVPQEKESFFERGENNI